MNAIQTAVSNVTNLLADGSYDVLEAMTHGRRLSASDLQNAVQTYGRTLVPLPVEELEDLDVVEVKDAEVPTYNVVVDLWTEQEGHSDLSLELLLTDRYGGAYDVEILNLHVL